MTINNRRQNDNNNNNNSDSGKEDDYEATATQRHINDSDSDNAEEKRKMRARSAGRQQGSEAARQDRKTNSLTHINRHEISQRCGKATWGNCGERSAVMCSGKR